MWIHAKEQRGRRTDIETERGRQTDTERQTRATGRRGKRGWRRHCSWEMRQWRHRVYGGCGLQWAEGLRGEVTTAWPPSHWGPDACTPRSGREGILRRLLPRNRLLSAQRRLLAMKKGRRESIGRGKEGEGEGGRKRCLAFSLVVCNVLSNPAKETLFSPKNGWPQVCLEIKSVSVSFSLSPTTLPPHTQAHTCTCTPWYHSTYLTLTQFSFMFSILELGQVAKVRKNWVTKDKV